MLTHLRVVNMGVLADATLDPGPGLTVITGETGAGKTLLLGGLRLLLGEKADSALVGPQGDETIAEALFTTDSDEIAVTRVVPREGRSRAYSDGVIVSAAALADGVAPFVEIVGQHDQLSLRRPAVVLGLVDSAGESALREVSERYQAAWAEVTHLRGELTTLGGDEMALRRELDLLRYQVEEIMSAQIAPGLDSELETEASRLRNVTEITEHLGHSIRLLEQMADHGGEVVSRVRKVADLDPTSGHLAPAAELVSESIHELSRELSRAEEGLEVDPARLEAVERRLNQIGDLKRKYGRTLEEVQDFASSSGLRAQEIDRFLSRAETIGVELEQAQTKLMVEVESLREHRRQAAATLAERAKGHLSDLGLSTGSLRVKLESMTPGPTGGDRPELWFTSDAGLDPAPVGSGASGGELSRLVLAIRLASMASSSSVTLVFDEIDTGIGGVTALAMGRKLAELATSTQVICVTHLPQVAAHADTHYVVDRDGAVASATRVEGDDRVREISRMLAGLPESDAASVAATELLARAAR